MHDNPVLIVDDEQQVRDIIARYLHTAGVRTEPASNSQEALDRIERGGVALMIIDLRLGNERGTDLLDKIRGLDPAMPVVFCSGYPSMADYYHDVELLPKPQNAADWRKLILVVKTMIRHRCRDVQSAETHTMMKDVHTLVMHPDKGLEATRKMAERAEKRTLGEMLLYYKTDPIFWLLILAVGGMFAKVLK